MFWSEVDGALLRESVKFADPIRESIKAQVNIDDIIDQWRLSYPDGATVTTAEARAWAKVNVVVDNTELSRGLGVLFATGWLFGKDVATSAYAHARLNKAAPTDEALNSLLNVDWANWTPGRNPGALLASPPDGLKRLLQRRGLDLQGLTNTLLNRIGTHLSDALMSGASDTVLGKVLETVVGDPERALTIANTSMASAMSVATRETYQEFGLAQMRWLALEPCNTCSGNGALGPVTVGEAVFKNVQGDNITEPPAHPNCRCALAPYIDLDQFKYSASQSRDDSGRWSSGNAWGGRTANVSTSAPYVGLSDKAKDVASRIGPSSPTEIITKPYPSYSERNAEIRVTNATYTAKNGEVYEMELSHAKQIVGDGKDSNFVGVTVNASNEQKIGSIEALEAPGTFYTIIGVDVNGAQYQRQGIATAMLEFARRESPLPILHSSDLTEEGQAFADSVKYSANQSRDAEGRWSSGAGSHLARLQNSQVAQAGFVNSITEDETKALVKYKGSDFAGMNKVLRYGNIPPELASMQKKVDDLDSLIEKAPAVDETFTVHRVVMDNNSGSQFLTRVENLERGWSFKDPAFTSTTIDKSHAESLMRIAETNGQKVLLMNLMVQKGQKGLFVEPLVKGKSDFSVLHEEEFLLPRNSVFTKIGNNPDGSVDMVVELD